MKITHICHSCFLVELSHTLLLFDYFQGPLPVLDPEKTLFVFSSHRHHDHYSPAVWELSDSHPNVFYVLEMCIRDRIRPVLRLCCLPSPAGRRCPHAAGAAVPVWPDRRCAETPRWCTG